MAVDFNSTMVEVDIAAVRVDWNVAKFNSTLVDVYLEVVDVDSMVVEFD
jgi:hypothetical protein